MTREEQIVKDLREYDLWDSAEQLVRKAKRNIVYLTKLDYYNYKPTDTFVYPFDKKEDAIKFEKHCIKVIKQHTDRAIKWNKGGGHTKEEKKQFLKEIKELKHFTKPGHTHFDNPEDRYSEIRWKEGKWIQKPGVTELFRIEDYELIKSIMDKEYKKQKNNQNILHFS